MALDSFKRTAELNSKIEGLNSQLRELTTSRTKAIVADFVKNASQFLEQNDFRVQRQNDHLLATYESSKLEFELPKGNTAPIGAYAIIPLSVNSRTHWQIMLVPAGASTATVQKTAQQATELERLEKQAADLEKTIQNYNTLPVYGLQYRRQSNQPSSQSTRPISVDSVEALFNAILESQG